VLVAALLPREWFGREEPRRVMTVSLGGTPGPRSTGQTSIGGRTVEQVAPPPRRPEPVTPVSPKPPTPEAPAVRTPPRAEAPPAETPRPAARPTPRPPTTGRQVARGSTPVDTGAVGQGAGLSFGGDEGLGGMTDLADFCCEWYLTQMTAAIDGNWRKNQPERGGTTILKFTVARNGAIQDVALEQSSGNNVLDRAARAALRDTTLPALPGEYTSDTLIIHLKFPYGSQ
jgi:periplasmic protein TonB